MIRKAINHVRMKLSPGPVQLPPDVTPDLLASLQAQIQSHEKRPVADQSLRGMQYIVFDTETTGFHPYAGDEIISLSAVIVKDGERLESPVFDRLVNPGREIPETVVKLTSITQEQADRSPSLIRILPEFLEFVGTGILVAHPAAFDMNFINLKLRRYCKATLRHHVIDMMAVAYHLFPLWKDYSLERLADHYGIEWANRHQSLADAILTAEIWSRFLDELERRGVRTLYNLFLYIKSLK